MCDNIEALAKELYERNPATKAMFPPIPIPWDQASDLWKDEFRSLARKANGSAADAQRKPEGV